MPWNRLRKPACASRASVVAAAQASTPALDIQLPHEGCALGSVVACTFEHELLDTGLAATATAPPQPSAMRVPEGEAGALALCSASRFAAGELGDVDDARAAQLFAQGCESGRQPEGCADAGNRFETAWARRAMKRAATRCFAEAVTSCRSRTRAVSSRTSS